MLNIKYFAHSLTLACIMLASVISVSIVDIKPTVTAFTNEQTRTATFKLRDWTIDVGVTPSLLDGKCAKFSFPSTSLPHYSRATFQVSKSSSMTSPIAQTLTLTSGGANSVDLKNLSGNTTYYYRSRLEDSHKIEWSTIHSFRTNAAAAPGDYFDCSK